MNSIPLVKHISECYIKPKYQVEESKQPYYLSPFDQIFLSMHYNQKGLLFAKPTQEAFNIDELLESLKHSLALTLVHFYPLAGQFETIIDEDQHRCLVFVDCNKGLGVRFTQAKINITVSDITTPIHVPEVVKSFFDHQHGGEVVNYDGHSRPLLSIQVTELVDGIFIGSSMNHVLVDGTSFWHFWNVWSQIQRAYNKGVHIINNNISNPPIHKRWVPNGYDPKDAFLPFISPNEFIHRFDTPPLIERFFHFSSKTISKLKSQANNEISNSNISVSSFQALTAFLWSSMIRAKGLKPTQVTHCKLAANNRTRLDPPLPEEYFGNALAVLVATTTVGELLEQNLGKTALLLHHSVVSHTDKTVQEFANSWFKSPFVMKFDKLLDVTEDNVVQVGSSPRFNIYGNEFAGIGKPIAVRSGFANKFGGKVIVYPGSEGDGSIDAEICLPSPVMRALECDAKFMAAVDFS